ncbi:MAG: transposase [Planctomycetaceae bacterium]|nr:transposase [Planctomycetaceae bacterium]
MEHQLDKIHVINDFLVLKTLYSLSDENTELLIRDRLSFREFLGLSFSDVVPDARTI